MIWMKVDRERKMVRWSVPQTVGGRPLLPPAKENKGQSSRRVLDCRRFLTHRNWNSLVSFWTLDFTLGFSRIRSLWFLFGQLDFWTVWLGLRTLVFSQNWTIVSWTWTLDLDYWTFGFETKEKKLIDTGFLDFPGYWMRNFGFSWILEWLISYQSTSNTKIYPQGNVNKSNTSRFKKFGIYCKNRKIIRKALVE